MSLSPFSILPHYFSDSSTSFLLLFHMTTWPSGLRRVTRNHFSSGGVGSNPAVVVFCSFPSFSPFPPLKKWFHPDSNWGPENQNLICCPYTMGPLSILYPHLDDIALHLYFFFSLLTYSPEFRLYIHTYPHTHTPSYPHTYPTFLSVISVRLIFLPCPLFFFHAFPTYYKKTPPVGLEPTTLRLKAARSTD